MVDNFYPYMPPFEKMCGFVETLKSKGYGIYLLSNASPDFHERRSGIPALSFFDGVIISADHKLLKPEKEIYEKLYETFDLNPSECFFIDDVAVHVLRCFENSDIVHVEGSIDPIRDAETVETELMLADLESLEKRLNGVAKKAQTGDKESKAWVKVIEPALQFLRNGQPARLAKPTDAEDLKLFNQLALLTAKPVLYVCNVDDNSAASGNEFSKRVAEMAQKQGNSSVVICAGIEQEIAQLPPEEQPEFLETLGLTETGLDRIIKAGYKLLGLETFFTSGPKEAHAWTMRKGILAPQAAGIIHSDFEKGFIRADTLV